MVTHGKEIFKDNVTQFITIIVSLGLAIVAQKLSGDLAKMALIPFIKEGFALLITSEHLSILHNFFLPLLMYFISCGCLLWMGITNLVTCSEIADKSFILLKVLLGALQLLFFAALIVVGVKLISYFLIVVFTVIILVNILNYAASTHEMQKE